MTTFAPATADDDAPVAPEGAGLVPGWLQRLAAVGWRLLATIALGLALLWIAALLWTVTASILVAAIVAATFAPFVLNLRDRGWSRIKAAAAVFVGAGVVIIATLAVVAIAFLPYIAQALDALSAGITALKAQLADLRIPPEVGAAIDQATQGLQAWLSSSVSDIAEAIGTAATIGILATFLTFFFMMDGDKAWVWAMSSTSNWRRDAITTAGHDALARVGGYLRGTAVIAAFDAVMEGLFLWILGVPLVLPLMVIVFFGRFIPYIGGLITTFLLLIVTLGTAGSTAAIILLVLIAILNVIQGKFLAPVIYHKTVHIHPAVALISLPAGAALAGIIGLFVAIPVVAFALAIVGAIISVLGVDPETATVEEPARAGLARPARPMELATAGRPGAVGRRGRGGGPGPDRGDAARSRPHPGGDAQTAGVATRAPRLESRSGRVGSHPRGGLRCDIDHRPDDRVAGRTRERCRQRGYRRSRFGERERERQRGRARQSRPNVRRRDPRDDRRRRVQPRQPRDRAPPRNAPDLLLPARR